MSDSLLQRATDLHQSGRIAEAAQIYQQILRANPQHYVALYSLAFAYLQSNRFEEAQRLFGAASAIAPGEVDPWYYRAGALYHLGQRDEALRCYDRALAIDPGHVEALTNRAAALIEQKRPAEALASCDMALALRADFIPALVNRGNALSALKRHEDAIASYDRALALQPGIPQAIDNRDNALFELGITTRCPPNYMRRLFDGFSVDYDSRMLHELGYRAHLHLRTLADRTAAFAAPLRILDLGSGTGLVGEAFQDLARGGRLDGVDLAPLMIEAARKRGLYDDLVLADLETYLPGPGPSYDLVLAADTMIYLGDLAPTFAGVAHRLVPDGFYIFAVEAKDGEGWEKTPGNRFRHSIAYIKAEAARAGLDFADLMECALRAEANVPVAGYAVALRKPL